MSNNKSNVNEKKYTIEQVKDHIVECNSFDDIDVPFYIITFLSSLKMLERTDNAMELYPLLIRGMPKGLARPTVNQWLYFYNICERQRLTDGIVKAIEYNVNDLKQTELLEETEDVLKRKKWLNSLLKNLKHQYLEFSKDLLKYTNDGLNRESREQTTDKIIKAQLSPLDVGASMREANRRVIEGDYTE